MSQPFPVAVVGLGKMGILHGSLLSVMPGVRIAAVCDRHRAALRFLRRLWPAATATTRLEDLRGRELAGLVVATPIRSHGSVCAEALSTGLARSLLVEKTLASNAREAEDLARYVAAGKGTILVGYQRRFSVTFREARELLRRGAIGRVESFEAYALSSDGLYAEDVASWGAVRAGVLRDLGSHALSLALWYFGNLRVEDGACEVEGPPGGEASAAFSVRAEGGARGRFRCSWTTPGYRMPEVGFSIRGAEGEIVVTDDVVRLQRADGVLVRHRHDLDDRADFLLGGPEYYRQDAHFVEASRRGDPLLEDVRDAVRVEQVIDEVHARCA